MANYSYTEITFTGELIDIEFAVIELKSNMEDEWLNVSKYITNASDVVQRSGYSPAEVIQFDYEDGSDTIYLSLSGRWCSPHKYIEDLCKRHNLSGTYADEESGCDFFHEMKFENGKKVHDKESAFFSEESIRVNGIERYIEEYQFITEEEDWENENDGMIKLFKKYGYNLDDLKKVWGL